MKILVDMNLSPEWIGFFSANGVESVHGSKVGSGNAEDSILLALDANCGTRASDRASQVDSAPLH